MNIFYKPYFEYNLIDSILVYGILLLAIVAFYAIKLGILWLKLHIRNKKDK